MQRNSESNDKEDDVDWFFEQPTLVHREQPDDHNQTTLAQPDRITLPHDPKPPFEVTQLVRRAGDGTKFAHQQPPPSRAPLPQRRKPLEPVRPVYKPPPSPRVATKRPFGNDPVHGNPASNDEDDIDWFFDKPHRPTQEAWDAFQGQLQRFIDPPEDNIWRIKRLTHTLTNKNRRLR